MSDVNNFLCKKLTKLFILDDYYCSQAIDNYFMTCKTPLVDIIGMRNLFILDSGLLLSSVLTCLNYPVNKRRAHIIFYTFLRLYYSQFFMLQKSETSLSSTFSCLWELPVLITERYASKSLSHFGAKRHCWYAYHLPRGTKWGVSSSTWQCWGE